MTCERRCSRRSFSGDLPHDHEGHRAGNILRREGLTTAEQVERLTDEELLAMRGCGPNLLALIRAAFGKRCLECGGFAEFAHTLGMDGGELHIDGCSVPPRRRRREHTGTGWPVMVDA